MTTLARKSGADEIHVHLLAEDESDAENTVDDLKRALSIAVRVRTPEPEAFVPQRRCLEAAGLSATIHGQTPAEWQTELFR